MLGDDRTVLEETHYYPFGLTQKGISYPNTAVPENKKKFNGIEQTQELGLNQYDAFFRTMDPQVGRWWQIDPKPTHSESLYAAMGNNPARYTDFLGDTIPKRLGLTSNIVFSAAKWLGPTLMKNDKVRVQYGKGAAKLEPTDKAGRANLKENARTKHTSAV